MFFHVQWPGGGVGAPRSEFYLLVAFFVKTHGVLQQNCVEFEYLRGQVRRRDDQCGADADEAVVLLSSWQLMD